MSGGNGAMLSKELARLVEDQASKGRTLFLFASPDSTEAGCSLSYSVVGDGVEPEDDIDDVSDSGDSCAGIVEEPTHSTCYSASLLEEIEKEYGLSKLRAVLPKTLLRKVGETAFSYGHIQLGSSTGANLKTVLSNLSDGVLRGVLEEFIGTCSNVGGVIEVLLAMLPLAESNTLESLLADANEEHQVQLMQRPSAKSVSLDLYSSSYRTLPIATAEEVVGNQSNPREVIAPRSRFRMAAKRIIQQFKDASTPDPSLETTERSLAALKVTAPGSDPFLVSKAKSVSESDLRPQKSGSQYLTDRDLVSMLVGTSIPRYTTWQSEFSRLLQDANHFEKESKTVALGNFVNDFTRAATMYAKVIASEMHLPYRSKSIRPALGFGGIAGGQKYVAGGIFFKFSTDSKGLYGSDFYAAKAARHDLRSVSHVFDVKPPEVDVPLTCVIEYKAVSVLAQALMPISGSDTLVCGSCDAGETMVATDAKGLNLMKQIGRRLNLKEHLCSENVSTTMCGDSELHYSEVDRRYYLLDLARVMPPEPPPASFSIYNYRRATSSNGALCCVLTRQLRPELVSKWETPLCSDAYTLFDWDPEDRANHKDDIKACHDYLIFTLVPQFAQWLENEDPSDSLVAITDLMHQWGINVRNLKHVYDHLTNEAWRRLCMAEMAARVMKEILFGLVGEMNSRVSKRLPLEQPLVRLVITFINTIFSDTSSKLSMQLWKEAVNISKFKFPSSEETKREFLSMTSKLHAGHLLDRLISMCGVDVRRAGLNTIFEKASISDAGKDFILHDGHIIGVKPRIHVMSIIGIGNGIKLYRQACSVMNGDVDSNSLQIQFLQQAIDSFHSTNISVDAASAVYIPCCYMKLALALMEQYQYSNEKCSDAAKKVYSRVRRLHSQATKLLEEYLRRRSSKSEGDGPSLSEGFTADPAKILPVITWYEWCSMEFQFHIQLKRIMDCIGYSFWGKCESTDLLRLKYLLRWSPKESPFSDHSLNRQFLSTSQKSTKKDFEMYEIDRMIMRFLYNVCLLYTHNSAAQKSQALLDTYNTAMDSRRFASCHTISSAMLLQVFAGSMVYDYPKPNGVPLRSCSRAIMGMIQPPETAPKIDFDTMQRIQALDPNKPGLKVKSLILVLSTLTGDDETVDAIFEDDSWFAKQIGARADERVVQSLRKVALGQYVLLVENVKDAARVRSLLQDLLGEGETLFQDHLVIMTNIMQREKQPAQTSEYFDRIFNVLRAHKVSQGLLVPWPLLVARYYRIQSGWDSYSCSLAHQAIDFASEWYDAMEHRLLRSELALEKNICDFREVVCTVSALNQKGVSISDPRVSSLLLDRVQAISDSIFNAIEDASSKGLTVTLYKLKFLVLHIVRDSILCIDSSLEAAGALTQSHLDVAGRSLNLLSNIAQKSCYGHGRLSTFADGESMESLRDIVKKLDAMISKGHGLAHDGVVSAGFDWKANRNGLFTDLVRMMTMMFELSGELKSGPLRQLLKAGLDGKTDISNLPSSMMNSLADVIRHSPEGMGIEPALEVAVKLTEGVGRLHEASTTIGALIPGMVGFGDMGALSIHKLSPDECPPALPKYLAPECDLNASTATTESDLYSLGCVIYELLTGSPPFKASSGPEYVQKHRNDKVAPISAHRSDAPGVLTTLVGILLAKHPNGRYRNAHSVHRDLKMILETKPDDRYKLVAYKVLNRNKKPSQLQSCSIAHGRMNIVNDVAKKFEQASRNTCLVAAVSGPPGSGKTHLSKVIMKKIGEDCKDVLLLSGQFRARDQFPLTTLMDALADGVAFLEESGRSSTVNLFTSLSSIPHESWLLLGQISPKLSRTSLYSEIVGMLTPRDDTAPPKTAGKVDITVVMRTLKEVLLVLREYFAIVCHFDDVQNISIQALEILQNLVGIDGKETALVLSYRSLDNLPTIRKGLDTLMGCSRVKGISFTLEGLSEEAVCSALGETFSLAPADVGDLGGIIYQLSKGVPGVLTELIGTMYQEGKIRFGFDEGRFVWMDPSTLFAGSAVKDVESILSSRILQLHDNRRDASTVLATMCVVGDDINLDDLALLVHMTPVALDDVMVVTRELGLALVHGNNASFAHERVCDTVRSLLDTNSISIDVSRLVDGLVFACLSRESEVRAHIVGSCRENELQLKAKYVTDYDRLGRKDLNKERVLAFADCLFTYASKNGQMVDDSMLMAFVDIGAYVMEQMVASGAQDAAQFIGRSVMDMIACHYGCSPIFALARNGSASDDDACAEKLKEAMDSCSSVWRQGYEQMFAFVLVSVQCEFLCRNVTIAMELFNLGLAHNQNKRHVVMLYRQYSSLLSGIGKRQECIDHVLACVKDVFGVEVEPNPDMGTLQNTVKSIEDMINEMKLDDDWSNFHKEISTTSDWEDFELAALLLSISGDAYLVGNMFLNMLLSVTVVQRALKRGFSKSSAGCLANFGFQYAHIFGHLIKGSNLGYAAWEIALTGDDEIVSSAVTAPALMFWSKGVPIAFDGFRLVYEASRRSQDVTNMSYCCGMYSWLVLSAFQDLDEGSSTLQEMHVAMKRCENEAFAAIVGGSVQGLDLMRDSTLTFSMEECQAKIASLNMPFATLGVNVFGILVPYYFLGKCSVAYDIVLQVDKDEVMAPCVGMWSVFEGRLFFALYYAWKVADDIDGDDEAVRTARGMFDKHLQAVSEWAEASPHNFGHRRDLLEAERYRMDEEHLNALRKYESSRVMAIKTNFLNIALLSLFGSAKCYVELGMNEPAIHCLKHALTIATSIKAFAVAAGIKQRLGRVLMSAPDANRVDMLLSSNLDGAAAAPSRATPSYSTGSSDAVPFAIDNSPDGICIINSQGNISQVNSVFCSYLGYSKFELLGKNVSMLMPEPHASRHDGYIATALDAGRRSHLGVCRELPALSKAGDIVRIAATLTEAIIDNKMTFTATVRPATSNMDANLVEASLDPVITTYHDGTIRSANNAVCAMLGFSREQLIGSNVKMIMPPEYSRKHDAYMRAYFARSGKDVKTRLIGKTRMLPACAVDGRTINIDLSLSVVSTSAQTIFVATLRERVTEEKILSAIRTPMVIVGQNSIIRVVNTMFTERFGWSKAEITGENVKILMPEPYASAHHEHLQRCIKAGGQVKAIPRIFPVLDSSGDIVECELVLSCENIGQMGAHQDLVFLASFYPK